MNEEDQKVPVEQPQDASGETETKESKPEQKDTVDYASYAKLLKEKKAMQERAKKADEYEQMLREREEQELQKQGKTEELLDRYKTEAQKLREGREKDKKTFAWKTISSEIEKEAFKMGCKDPVKLIRLMEDEDLKSIEYDEDLKINKDTLKTVLEKTRLDNDFLFQNTPSKIANGIPSREPQEDKFDIKSLSNKEIEDMLKKLSKQK